MRSSRTPNRFETSLVGKQRPDAALDRRQLEGSVLDAAAGARERVGAHARQHFSAVALVEGRAAELLDHDTVNAKQVPASLTASPACKC
jgi:hypothetical protein